MKLFNIKLLPIQQGALSLPKWVSNKGLMVGIAAILAVSLIWVERILPLKFWIYYLIELVGFFYGGYRLSRSWAGLSVRGFTKQLITWAIGIRVVYILYAYWSYVNQYGEVFYDKMPDVEFYINIGDFIAESIKKGNLSSSWSTIQSWNVKLDDVGYSYYLSLVILLTGSNQFVPLLLKSIWGALTCMFVYRIGQRHFGEGVARLAAIFCLLNPVMVWWCASLFKETEMVFVAMWFLNGMDSNLSGGKLTIQNILPISLLGMYLFTYRNVLGVVAFLAVAFAVVTTSTKMVNRTKKWTTGIIVALVLFVGVGNSVIEQAQSAFDQRGSQKGNMEWRSERKDGANRFAKYASATVFAPLIFTIPFPTITYTYEGQEDLIQVAGGNLIKNLLSYFVIVSMFILLFTGEWRSHSFPLAYMLGYLLVLALSAFAQSGRFHMPVLPVEMLFAAYGIALANSNKKYKRWFSYAAILEVLICVAWSWFKLKGQGHI